MEQAVEEFRDLVRLKDLLDLGDELRHLRGELRAAIALLDVVQELLSDQVADRVVLAESLPDPFSRLALLDPDLVELAFGH